MNILLTNLTLASRTGTEIVTRDLATGLVRAGHRIAVFCPVLGSVAEEIAAGGVPVVDRLEDVPFRPDIIHGHHHVETTLALLHFRDIPAIFVCHDRLNWHDTPPRLRAIRRYVAVDRNCLERLVIEAGIPVEHTRLVLNAVDTERFRRRPPLPKVPRRALLFSNYAGQDSNLETIREVCRERGIDLEIAGSGVFQQVAHPEEILGNYDLVFAKARCALEALASGCAVILYHGSNLGPMVTIAEIQELREWNLGVRCLQQPLTTKTLHYEIERYEAAYAARVTDLVRVNASLDKALAKYLKLYEDVCADSDGFTVSPRETVQTLAENIGFLESRLRAAREPLCMPPLPRSTATQVSVDLCDKLRSMAPGGWADVEIEVRNVSAEVLVSAPPYAVHLSYHWLDVDRRCVEFDGERTPLFGAVRPRSRHRQKMRVKAPKASGRYTLVLSLVQEKQFWFDEIAPAAGECEVSIQPNAESSGQVTLALVAAWGSAQLARDGRFLNLGFLSDPKEQMLTFIEGPQFLSVALACESVAAVLTKPEFAAAFPECIAVAIADDPKRSFFEIHNRLVAETTFYGRDFDSIIDPSARLHTRCWVDEKNVIIGAGAVVGPNASVLGRVAIGSHTNIFPGAVIGSAGFQSSRRSEEAIELVHAGGIEISADCQIFSNAVIASGLFRQNTRIGRGCRIGNGAFLSHNCTLGDGVFVGHGAVLNGNVKVGLNAWIGPGATLMHGIEIGATAQVSLGATVCRDVQPGERVTGGIAIGHRRMLRLVAADDDRRGER